MGLIAYITDYRLQITYISRCGIVQSSDSSDCGRAGHCYMLAIVNWMELSSCAQQRSNAWFSKGKLLTSIVGYVKTIHVSVDCFARLVVAAQPCSGTPGRPMVRALPWLGVEPRMGFKKHQDSPQKSMLGWSSYVQNSAVL